MFKRRRIDLKFQFGSGDFGAGGGNFGSPDQDTLELKGLRCSVDVNIQGANAMPHLDLRVFGMTLDQMHRLTILNSLLLYSRYNIVNVLAGDDDQMSLVFSGGIIEAWADLKGQPEGAFHVAADTGYYDKIKPNPPASFRGAVDVMTVIRSIASRMTPPRTVQGFGISTQLFDPYLPGTLGDQLDSVLRHAKLLKNDDGQILTIYPERADAPDFGVVEINSKTGMVGYPSFAQNAISLRTIYNPAIRCGQKAKVTSTLESATGTFNIYQLRHSLDSETPNGAWFTDVSLQITGQDAPIPT